MMRPTPDQHNAHQERHTPSPGEELIRWQLREQRKNDRRCQEPGRYADLRPAAVEAALSVGGVLNRHQHGPAPLAADAEALNDPEDDEEDGRPGTDGGIGRQRADETRRHAHHHQRQHEHRTSTHFVAVMADDDGANRARHETDRVCAERQKRTDKRIERREEQLVEDKRRGGVVQEEVVPLDRRADQAGECNEPDRTGFIAAQLILRVPRSTRSIEPVPRGGLIVLPHPGRRHRFRRLQIPVVRRPSTAYGMACSFRTA